MRDRADETPEAALAEAKAALVDNAKQSAKEVGQLLDALAAAKSEALRQAADEWPTFAQQVNAEAATGGCLPLHMDDIPHWLRKRADALDPPDRAEETPERAERCRELVKGYYGDDCHCVGPEGHDGEHRPTWRASDWPSWDATPDPAGGERDG